jgi:hypothetical protein
MITNIDLIKSDILKVHIYSLYDKVVDMCIFCENLFREENSSKLQLRSDINRLLYHNVIGVNNPICLSDYYVSIVGGYVIVSMCIDFKVFSQFKPCQSDTIFLEFKLDNCIIRNYKIEKII